MLPTFADRKFVGPEIPNLDIVEATGEHPVFISTDQVLYDINYLPSGKSVRVSGEGTVDSDALLLIPTFPDPNNYETFFDYEQAVVEWKVEIEHSLEHLKIPSTLGRIYYRPRRATNIKESALLRNWFGLIILEPKSSG